MAPGHAYLLFGVGGCLQCPSIWTTRRHRRTLGALVGHLPVRTLDRGTTILMSQGELRESACVDSDQLSSLELLLVFAQVRADPGFYLLHR